MGDLVASSLDPVATGLAHPEALAPFCWIKSKVGRVPLALWPMQRELVRAVVGSRKVLLVKARQLGMSWALALVVLWWAMAKAGQLVVLVSIGEREAKSLLAKVKYLYASLPVAFRAAVPLAVDQSLELHFVHGDQPSRVLSLPSSSTAGRGETVDLLIGDERPHWPNADEQESSLLPAAEDGGTIVMIGTANGMDRTHERWYGHNEWVKLFAGALSRPDRSLEWVLEKRKELGDAGPQEYPLDVDEAFLASGRCAFASEDLADLMAHCAADPVWRGWVRRDESGGRLRFDEDRFDGAFRVWEWPQPGRQYLVAADPAGGRADGDYSAAVVYDRETWEQVAAYHYRSEPAVFARDLIRLGLLYRWALLAPEANNHGQAVVALLAGWRYPAVYRSRTLNKRRQRVEERLGWVTTEQTRTTAIHALEMGVSEGTLGIRDREAIAEMQTFIYRETERGGRFEAEEGKHDDHVMCHAIAAAVLSMTRAAAPTADRVDQPPVDAAPVTGYAIA